MLTEQEITRSWGKLFKNSKCDEKVLEKAKMLLVELRPESPLRHRLSIELEELEKIYAQKCG